MRRPQRAHDDIPFALVKVGTDPGGHLDRRQDRHLLRILEDLAQMGVAALLGGDHGQRVALPVDGALTGAEEGQQVTRRGSAVLARVIRSWTVSSVRPVTTPRSMGRL